MKKAFLLCVVFIALFFSCTYSQSFQWAVHGGCNSGDYGNSIAVDAQGNSFVTGWYQNTATFGTVNLTSAGGYDIFIIKYDNSGQVVWAQSAGGINNDIGYGIDLDANGNIYVAGAFTGTAMFGTAISVTSVNNSSDIFVARYDMNGNPVWVQQAGSTTDDQAQAIAVDKAAAKIYVSGYFKNNCSFGSLSVTSSGQSDIFIAKYDTLAAVNSTPMWVQKGGGAGYDIPYGVSIDAAGSVYVTGVFTGNANFDGMPAISAGGDDIFLAKYNSSGIIQWVHRDGGTQGDKGLAVAASGTDIYYTGWFSGSATIGSTNLTGAGLDEIFIAKIDAAGNSQWADKAGGTGYDQGYGICTDGAGNVYATGSYDSVATFGTTTLTSAGSWDVFIAKYSASGIFQWVMSGGSPASNTFERDIGYSIKADTSHNLYATGIIRNTASFGSNSITSNGIQDVFVTKISLLTSAATDASKNEIIIYPDPVHDFLFIRNNFSPYKILHAEIYNTLGKKVFDKNVSAVPNRIDVSNLVNGIYFIRVQDGNVLRVAKFVRN